MANTKKPAKTTRKVKVPDLQAKKNPKGGMNKSELIQQVANKAR